MHLLIFLVKKVKGPVLDKSLEICLYEIELIINLLAVKKMFQ